MEQTGQLTRFVNSNCGAKAKKICLGGKASSVEGEEQKSTEPRSTNYLYRSPGGRVGPFQLPLSKRPGPAKRRHTLSDPASWTPATMTSTVLYNHLRISHMKSHSQAGIRRFYMTSHHERSYPAPRPAKAVIRLGI